MKKILTFLLLLIPSAALGWGIIITTGGLNIWGNDAYTVLLLHMDGTDDAQVFTDSSATPHTITANGNVKTEDTEKKFGVTSAYFDGTDDWLSVPDHADWDFNSGDFTIDFWLYPTAWGNHFIGQRVDADNRWSIYDSGDGKLGIVQILATAVKFNILTADVDMTLNTWQHIAVVRDGNNFHLFVDGTLEDTGVDADDMPNFATDLTIGRAGGAGLIYTTGYIDELRISKGIARWTANFTPPTKAYD